MEAHCSRPASGRRWWLEIEVAWLIVLVAGIYFLRLTDLTIRGEESRRARIAEEMMESGDWIVPRQQGQPFLSRPPLQNWLIALTALCRGQCDLLAVRFSTALATLLTVLLIYGYSRNFLSPMGALAAGAAYATMGQVMVLGGLAETEATFTLLVSASLMVWHWGHVRGWPAPRTWVASYALVALGALAKGPQAPTYFAASVGLFLILTGQWRLLFTRAHLAGILTFAGLISAWQIPFYRQLGWEGVKQVWASDSAIRLREIGLTAMAPHLMSYPFEVLGCTLPWSLLLTLYATRPLRQSLGQARPAVMFLVTCLAITFPSCWMVPGARGRYFMPLYPCLAPLIGLVIQRCFEAEVESPLWRCWRRFLTGLAILMLGAAIAVPVASWLEKPVLFLSQPRSFAVGYALAAIALAVLALWSQHSTVVGRRRAGILALATFLGLCHTGLFINTIGDKSENPAPAVAQLKALLPTDQPLVSLGVIHHAFVYYLDQPVPLLAWPESDARAYRDMTYFCFEKLGPGPISLPFAWEQVAAISFDRYRSSEPFDRVIVGRRLPTAPVTPGPNPPEMRYPSKEEMNYPLAN